MKWRLAGTLLASLAMVVATAPPMAAVAQAREIPAGGVPGVRVPELTWTACADAPRLQCATAEVPLDYTRPRGRRVTLALARIPAADRAKRAGSLVVNRGGPGYSAVDYLQGIVTGALPGPVNADVLARYDIVGVDPRGSGRSVPAVRCFADAKEAEALASGVSNAPVTAGERRQRAKADARYASLCRKRGGDLLDHVSTVAIARDLDVVRAALGEDRLNYLGQSYGTYLGMVYANMFTNRTGRFVFDSVLDPTRRDAGGPGTTPSARTGSDVATRRTLEEFFRLCEEAGERCAFGGGDPEAAFDRILDVLRRGPVRLKASDGATVPLTYSFVVTWTGSWLYQPMFWNEQGGGAPFLKAVAEAIEDPSGPAGGSLAADVVLLQQAGIGGTPYTSPIVAAYHAVTCGETDGPRSARALERLAAERDRDAAPFGTLRAYESSPCVPWHSANKLRHRGPWHARTREPVLILSSRFDPATPVWSAQRVHDMLPGSRLLINEGWGHVAAQQSGCVVTATSRYLVDGTLPAKGATCRPDTIPFAAS
ncbi:alpha/beta fold hydrolase [Nonomuraea terrae]|uniref:Alpha/beta fold hydrolase n=1 Tax=Nonomuraea terrae TaxID=2530383 RepID=A0A4R4ZFZ9_9ACTN|nr:alpha/beta fold hydrolase [Nonomuraea terrae]TDD56970.1 alpha/beta fold hydrolase [Nonomuraea terrae]